MVHIYFPIFNIIIEMKILCIKSQKINLMVEGHEVFGPNNGRKKNFWPFLEFKISH